MNAPVRAPSKTSLKLKAEHGAFACCFVVASAISVAAGGCSGMSENCQSFSDFPEAQAPLMNVEFSSYDGSGNATPLAFEPRDATLEVTGATVVIQYDADGVAYDVEYEVVAD